MNIVVVESPAKAKTINKYLGRDFRVLASYGHIRDLPSKDGSVQPDHDFAMKWEIDSKAERHVAEIAKALKGADRLYLATDPDREGEAISWHVQEVLKNRKVLEGVEVARVVFNEVTKDAVLDAMRHPRSINRELVEAYLARRALDYLVGFTLSPVLWRKLPGARSAGRVQSVALRLVCEREAEIEAFRPREYWTIDVDLKTAAGAPFKARLARLGRDKLDKFALPDRAAAEAARARIAAQFFHVAKIERKQIKRNPFPPFTTSTLQQEASRKLGLGAARTMRVAQRLYEGVDIGGETVGLITYMRTDSVHLSREAMAAARAFIALHFGDKYLPEHARQFRATAKNAQEAHEAIRPTDIARRPEDIARHLDNEQLRLYELIWKRAVASQMESAALEQVGVDIVAKDDGVGLRASGQMILFDGFLRLYREDRDDTEDEEGEGILPQMAEGEPVVREAIHPEQHFTQPPPRYSEASLVKKLEELGIGRPSTYASIIQVLQDRKYVRLEKKRFIPEDRGRVVTAFLANFFQRYVEYDFTAGLENSLDDVSNGRIPWKNLLSDFWRDFIAAVNGTKHLTIRQVLDTLDKELGPHFFPETQPGQDPRLCPACGTGRLGLKLGKYGAFLGCSRYPDCTYTRPLAVASAEGEGAAAETMAFPKELGTDPANGTKVTLRKGPYGAYVQLGEASKEHKPKRASLPKGVKPEDVTLVDALRYLSLPREVGAHPETGKMIVAGIGRFGPYLKHDEVYQSLKDDDVLTIGLNRAVAVLKDAKPKMRQKGRDLGAHPDDGKSVTLHSGRYGPYVAHNKLRASLPRDASPDSYTLEEAVALLAARAEAAGAGKKVKQEPAETKPAKPKRPAGAKAKGKKTAKSARGKDAGEDSR